MKKKILLIVLSALLVSGALYLQFGRQAVVTSSLTETTTSGYDLQLSITVNTLFIADNEKLSKTLISKVLDNDFQNMQFSYDVNGYPNQISVTVYANATAKALGLPAFRYDYDVYSLEGELFFGHK